MQKKKTTIKDIAEFVGVSPMTVSFVLNKNPNQKISEVTTKKILDAVKELKYIPNNSAKSLRTSQTNCIGVCIDKTLLAKRYTEVIDGIRTVLSKQGYNILLCKTEILENTLPEYLNFYFERRIDGIIFVGRDGLKIDEKHILEIKKNEIPFVALDCEGLQEYFTTVDYDYFSGATCLAEYFVSNNTKKIIYIKPNFETYQEMERLKGIKSIVEKYKMELKIYNIPYYDLNKSEKDLSRYMEEYEIEIKNSIEEIFLDNENFETTAFISSWGSWVEIIYATLQKKNISCKVGGLAEGSLSVEFWKNISYSTLPNFEAGISCAYDILNLIKNNTQKKNTLLQPILSVNKL